MYRPTSALWVLLLVAIGLSSEAQSDGELLLRVRVTDVVYSEPSQIDGCLDCIAFYTWFRYEARVREVIRGDYSRGTVNFANLQHAHFNRLPRDWYVLLEPCEPSVRNAVGSEYCVKDQAFAKDRAELKRLIGTQHGA